MVERVRTRGFGFPGRVVGGPVLVSEEGPGTPGSEWESKGGGPGSVLGVRCDSTATTSTHGGRRWATWPVRGVGGTKRGRDRSFTSHGREVGHVSPPYPGTCVPTGEV